MKYLKLYEAFKEYTLKDYFEDTKEDRKNRPPMSHSVSFSSRGLTSLEGIEDLTFIRDMTLRDNKLTSLKGIENLNLLYDLMCSKNKLTSLKGIENLKNLKNLDCSDNKLTNLYELKNQTKLERVNCSDNKLTNLDELENLPNLEEVKCWKNPLEYPPNLCVKLKIVDTEYYSLNWEPLIIYDKKQIRYFKSYEGQKNILTKYPDKIAGLNPFGILEEIKEEFPALIRGAEWGFFNLERSEE